MRFRVPAFRSVCVASLTVGPKFHDRASRSRNLTPERVAPTGALNKEQSMATRSSPRHDRCAWRPSCADCARPQAQGPRGGGAARSRTPPRSARSSPALAGVSEERLRRLAAHYACTDEELIDALVAMATDRTRGWWEEYRGVLPTSFLDLAELEHHATFLRDVAVPAHPRPAPDGGLRPRRLLVPGPGTPRERAGAARASTGCSARSSSRALPRSRTKR